MPVAARVIAGLAQVLVPRLALRRQAVAEQALQAEARRVPVVTRGLATAAQECSLRAEFRTAKEPRVLQVTDPARRAP